MSLRRKMQPAGRTLQQKDILPIKESNAGGVGGEVAQRVMPPFVLALCLLP